MATATEHGSIRHKVEAVKSKAQQLRHHSIDEHSPATEAALLRLVMDLCDVVLDLEFELAHRPEQVA